MTTNAAPDADLDALADDLLQDFTPQDDVTMMLEDPQRAEELAASAVLAIAHPVEDWPAASQLHSKMISTLESDTEITAKLAQQILHAQETLTASSLMAEHPGIDVQPTGATAHFLIHKDTSTARPAINPSGPKTGIIHPGDQGTYPERAMLKVSGTGEKAPGQTVSVWRTLLERIESRCVPCDRLSDAHALRSYRLQVKCSTSMPSPCGLHKRVQGRA